MRIELQHVQLMPQALRPGVLYVSKEFGTAHHLCACGCGSKIRTPLGPTEWGLVETLEGPTLRPSIGNWQRPCRSHYSIWRGRIEWAAPWSDEQVLKGRAREEHKRQQYYTQRERLRSGGFWDKVKRWFDSRNS